jgi:hypothetical protein
LPIHSDRTGGTDRARSFPIPTIEYTDDGTKLAVDLPGDGSIRVRAVSGPVGAAVDLGVVGAQRLATMLGSAVTAVIHRGLQKGGTE